MSGPGGGSVGGNPLQAMAANPSMFNQQSSDLNSKLTDPAMGGQGLLGSPPPQMPGAPAPMGNPMLPAQSSDPTANNAPPVDPRMVGAQRPAWINPQMWASMGGQ